PHDEILTEWRAADEEDDRLLVAGDEFEVRAIRSEVQERARAERLVLDVHRAQRREHTVLEIGPERDPRGRPGPEAELDPDDRRVVRGWRDRAEELAEQHRRAPAIASDDRQLRMLLEV